jgi:hypothetical protein
MTTQDVSIKKRKRFFRGGKTENKVPITLEQQAANSVGYNVFFSLSSEDQDALIAELLRDGIISAKLASNVFEEGGTIWCDFVHDFEDDGSVYILGSNDNGKNQILAKITPSGRTLYFIEEARDIPEVTEMILQVSEEGIYAKGGDIEEKIYVVSYKEKGSKVTTEKLFNDFESAELYHELMQEEQGVIVNDIVERVSEKPKVETKLPEQPKKSGFFARAKPVEGKAAASKKRERVQVDGIAEKIRKYDSLDAEIKNLEAEKEILSGELYQVGREKFLELYIKRSARPANFDLADGSENILFQVTDRYISVSQEKAEILRQFDGLLEEIDTYKFKTELLEKELENGITIGELISNFIESSDLLSEEDKEKLIEKETKKRITKGAINKLMDYEDPKEVFYLIQPVVALK